MCVCCFFSFFCFFSLSTVEYYFSLALLLLSAFVQNGPKFHVLVQCTWYLNERQSHFDDEKPAKTQANQSVLCIKHTNVWSTLCVARSLTCARQSLCMCILSCRRKCTDSYGWGRCLRECVSVCVCCFRGCIPCVCEACPCVIFCECVRVPYRFERLCAYACALSVLLLLLLFFLAGRSMDVSVVVCMGTRLCSNLVHIFYWRICATRTCAQTAAAVYRVLSVWRPSQCLHCHCVSCPFFGRANEAESRKKVEWIKWQKRHNTVAWECVRVRSCNACTVEMFADAPVLKRVAFATRVVVCMRTLAMCVWGLLAIFHDSFFCSFLSFLLSRFAVSAMQNSRRLCVSMFRRNLKF